MSEAHAVEQAALTAAGAGEGPEGEKKLSKNELKRRAKAEARRLEKEAKAKAKAEAEAKEKEKMEKPADKLRAAEDEEAELSAESYLELRRRVVGARGKAAYPHKFAANYTVPLFLEEFGVLAAGEHIEEHIVRIAGRLMSKRASGQRLVFYDLHADGTKVQVMADARHHRDVTSFQEVHGAVRVGDIVGIVGFPGRSKRGELSIWPAGESPVQVLTPCLHALPRLHFALKDQETRYRQRYLDLLVNPATRKIFSARAAIMRTMRDFLDARGFLEVETPMLSVLASGASAKPFDTRHNALNLDMHLRISPELYLKRLVVGGLDRVYELGRSFRNENMDLTHNPEFTMCEFYMAYADYNDLMDLTKEMVAAMCKAATGGYAVQLHTAGPDEPAVTIDFSPSNWRVVRMLPALEEAIGGEFKVPQDLDSEDARMFLEKACDEHEVECGPPRTTARLLDKLVGHYVEPKLVQPSFLIDHPRIMSPLAKWHRDDPERLTERFELFVAGRELCNAYTELNSPFVQRERFQQQAELAAKMHDEEAMPYDEDYCRALEYGLPPTAGWGLGIERLCMLLCDTGNIKEVLLFPAMKPQAAASLQGSTEERSEKL